jgi:hypothetical protein
MPRYDPRSTNLQVVDSATNQVLAAQALADTSDVAITGYASGTNSLKVD